MKQISILIPAIACAGLLTIGCGNNNTASTSSDKNNVAAFDMNAAKQIIEEKNKLFTKAHITGDTSFLNNIFTKDGKYFPPNSDVVTGHAAIAAGNLQWVNYGIKEFDETTTAFYGNEDYLMDEGTYVVIYGKDNIVDKGKYINIWKKEDGDWKIYSNIWNTSLPEAAAK